MWRSCMRSTRWSRTAAGSEDHLSICGITHPALLIWFLLAKDETTQLVAQPPDLFRIIGGAEAFGQLKERLLLLLSRFDSLLDQFDQDPVIAEIALLRQGLNLPGDLGRQSHASPHVLKSS